MPYFVVCFVVAVLFFYEKYNIYDSNTCVRSANMRVVVTVIIFFLHEMKAEQEQKMLCVRGNLVGWLVCFSFVKILAETNMYSMRLNDQTK